MAGCSCTATWPTPGMPATRAARRFAAVSLMRIKAATQLEVAEAFAVKPATRAALGDSARRRRVSPGCSRERKGPKRKSKLTGDTVAAIRRLRAGGASYRAIAADTGVSRGQRPQRARTCRRRHRYGYRGALHPNGFRCYTCRRSRRSEAGAGG